MVALFCISGALAGSLNGAVVALIGAKRYRWDMNRFSARKFDFNTDPVAKLVGLLAILGLALGGVVNSQVAKYCCDLELSLSVLFCTAVCPILLMTVVMALLPCAIRFISGFSDRVAEHLRDRLDKSAISDKLTIHQRLTQLETKLRELGGTDYDRS